MNFKKKKFYFCGSFLLDPDPLTRLNPDPIRIRNPWPVQDWIFPASKLWVAYSQTGHIPTSSSESTTATAGASATTTTEAVCQSAATTTAAFDLLVALCTNCPANLSLLARMLADMFYTTERGNGAPLTEWEYLPPVGPRPAGGFVGLKNAGATCYMNSVLQQLFMLEGIRQERDSVLPSPESRNFGFSLRGKDKSNGSAGNEKIYVFDLLPIITGTVPTVRSVVPITNVADPGSGDFLTPDTGILYPGGYKNQDPDPG
jgi:hypothetical protein